MHASRAQPTPKRNANAAHLNPTRPRRAIARSATPSSRHTRNPTPGHPRAANTHKGSSARVPLATPRAPPGCHPRHVPHLRFVRGSAPCCSPASAQPSPRDAASPRRRLAPARCMHSCARGAGAYVCCCCCDAMLPARAGKLYRRARARACTHVVVCRPAFRACCPSLMSVSRGACSSCGRQAMHIHTAPLPVRREQQTFTFEARSRSCGCSCSRVLTQVPPSLLSSWCTHAVDAMRPGFHRACAGHGLEAGPRRVARRRRRTGARGVGKRTDEWMDGKARRVAMSRRWVGCMTRGVSNGAWFVSWSGLTRPAWTPDGDVVRGISLRRWIRLGMRTRYGFASIPVPGPCSLVS